MGGLLGKPQGPPPLPPLPPSPVPGRREEYIDVDDEIYEIPESVKERLRGRSEVKRYLTRFNPVTRWISSLNDVRFTINDPPVHPFLIALTSLCHGSDLRTTVISTAIREGSPGHTPAATFFAFDEVGNIVGFSATSFDRDHPDELYREVTCTGVRRQGYGRMLDDAVLKYAWDLGKTRVRLEPADENARRIHSAMGFRPINRDYMVKEVLPPRGGRRRSRRTQKRSFLRKNKQWTRRR